MKTKFTTHTIHVHENMNREHICDGKRQALMWGSEVEPIIERRNGRVLVRWFDGIKNWHGWTYKDSLVKSRDEIF